MIVFERYGKERWAARHNTGHWEIYPHYGLGRWELSWDTLDHRNPYRRTYILATAPSLEQLLPEIERKYGRVVLEGLGDSITVWLWSFIHAEVRR